MARLVALPPHLCLLRLAAISLAMTLAAACPPGRAAAQDPTPTAIASWRIYLPIVHSPVKELILAPEVAQLGGRATGIAVAGGMIFQAQGATLLSWLPTGDERGWAYQGGLQLLDEAPITEAWLTADRGVLSFIRQLPGPPPGEEGQEAPFLRLSLCPIHADGARSAGAGIELPGRLISQARVGARLYLITWEGEQRGYHLATVDVGTWEAPRVLERQALPDRAIGLLALPEANQLLAIGRRAWATELWTWDIRSDFPRPVAPLAMDFDRPLGLLRVPEGILIAGRSGDAMIVPFTSGRLQSDRMRELDFDTTAARGTGKRYLGDIDAAVWAGNQVHLYSGIYVSTRDGSRSSNNLLAGYYLPAGGQPVFQQVLALDPVIDPQTWSGTPFKTAGGVDSPFIVAGDRVLMSRGDPGGIEVLGPFGGDAPLSARTLDAPPGRVQSVVRMGDRLITAEGDVQLRSWEFEPAAFGGLRPLGRLGAPLTGDLVTWDIAKSADDQEALPSGAATSEIVVWRGWALGRPALAQGARLLGDGSFVDTQSALIDGLRGHPRAAGNLLWDRTPVGDKVRRFIQSRMEPLTVPTLESDLLDVAFAGPLRLLAAGADGFIILDEKLELVGRLPLPDRITAVAFDPGTPTLAWLASSPPPSDARHGRMGAALHCVDFRDASAPRLVASIDVPAHDVDRIRAAGAGGHAARVVGAGSGRLMADAVDSEVPVLLSVDARDCSRPRLEAATRPDGPPDFMGLQSHWLGNTWDLSPDGRRIYAAREGLVVYRLADLP